MKINIVAEINFEREFEINAPDTEDCPNALDYVDKIMEEADHKLRREFPNHYHCFDVPCYYITTEIDGETVYICGPDRHENEVTEDFDDNWDNYKEIIQEKIDSGE